MSTRLVFSSVSTRFWAELLTDGDSGGAARHLVDHADETQTAGGQRGAGAEDAVVGGGRSPRGGRRRGGKVPDCEGLRLRSPVLQSEHHGQVLPCREKMGVTEVLQNVL